MREDRKEIIDELLKNFDKHRHFETDKFLYWIKDDYYYDGKKVTRDEFTHIKDYAVKHGTLPFISIKKKIRELRESRKDSKKDVDFSPFASPMQSSNHHDIVNTNTYCRQRIVRYSKSYENIDVYDYDIEVRSPARAKVKRVLVFSRKTKLFSVNDKNYVLIKGNRWLSLKNWHGFKMHDWSGMISNRLTVMLLSMMLGGKKWIEEFEEPTPYYISNKNSRKANSLDEAINLECGMTPPKTIKRALLNDVNEIINLYNMIDENKIHYLTNFIKRNHETLSSLLEQSYYSKGETILFYYFLSKDNRCDRNVFHDYMRMLKEEGQKINLNVSSYTTIKRNHDNLSRIILDRNKDKRRLQVSKIYPKIESIPGIEVEMIKKADRLDEESKMLHHCVHGYKSSINKGHCAIYSLVHDGERYTLEVQASKKTAEDGKEDYEFNINQLKGKYNCAPPESMKRGLQKMCENHEIILNDNQVRFVDKIIKIEDKKTPELVETKIEQIGEAILKTLVSIKSQPEYLPF